MVGLGLLLIIMGVGVIIAPKIPLIGRLPGDIRVKGEDGSFFFPITTCVVISLILTIFGNLLIRFFNK